MLNLKKLKSVHMVGIKGTGMSGLALALRSLGVEVNGSDNKDSFLLLDELRFRRAGIKIALDFDSENIPKNADAVIVSSQHLSKNPEVNKARKMKMPVLAYADVIGMLSKEYKSIAIAGSHGKTTTTNLLAYILQKSKMPVLAVAGPTSPQVLDQLPQPPLIDKRGTKGAFVFEADEYENKLKKYSPFGVILTSVELDHPDYFKSKAQYEKAFSDFVKKIPKDGFLVYCSDDPACVSVAKHAKCKKLPYGFHENDGYLVRSAENPSNGAPFAISPQPPLTLRGGASISVFRTSLLGSHNILNSSAAVLAAMELGVMKDDIQEALTSFRGSPRRMEKISREPLIYDDYGHHPAEIRATLDALRGTYPHKEIWVVFHPHTYSRTKKFLKEFGKSFERADQVIVLDIFESREAHASPRLRRAGLSVQIVSEIKKNKKDAHYCPTFEAVAKFLKGKLNNKTLLLTIGAGDVWKLHKLL